MRPIRGADLDESHARRFQNVRQPERTADLDEFAARDDDFASASERRDREQKGRRVVVDDERRFAAGEQRELATQRSESIAAAAARRDRVRDRCIGSPLRAPLRRRREPGLPCRDWCGARRPSRSRRGADVAPRTRAPAQRQSPRGHRAPAGRRPDRRGAARVVESRARSRDHRPGGELVGPASRTEAASRSTAGSPRRGSVPVFTRATVPKSPSQMGRWRSGSPRGAASACRDFALRPASR